MGTGGTGKEARPIRAIVVADPERTALILDELRRGPGVDDHVRVEDLASLKAAVGRRIWDVVLSDWSFPELSTMDTLGVLHELHRPIPLVALAGEIGEEAAAEAVRAGARDVVLFRNIGRLSQVVLREVLGDGSARNLRDVMRTGLLARAGEIGITLATLDGVFLDANDAFLRIVGYSREDLAAGRVRREAITPPEFDADDRRALAAIKAEGAIGVRQKEYIRKDGVRVPVLVSGLRLDDGTAVGLIVLDVTEQKRMERELRTATAFLDSIVENIPLMVFVKDARELRFERFNRAAEEILGFQRGEMLGKNDHDLYPREQADFFEAKDREALASREAVDITEEPVATPSGARWLRTMKMAIRDESGVPKHLLGISEDITSRREMAHALARTEQQLRQAQKMEAIGQLAGGIAHDFNNVLSVILSYAELGMADLRQGDPLRQDLAEIASAGHRAADLTKQLLSFSRQQVVRPRVVDLNEVLAGMDRMLGRLVEESIERRVVAAPSLRKVFADPTQIEQVVMNLVVNARDAMPDGGKLIVQTANVELDELFAQGHPGLKAGPHVMLTVSDTGTGMDPETASRVFEPFFTTKGVGKGTGLGLSTVYGIVQQSGGAISVYSEPGKGTTFKVYLPRARDEREQPVVTHPPPVAARRGTETILVVEDEESLLRLMTATLRKSGYKVLEASGPAEAILLSEQQPGVIDLLLTDVVMPQMNGRQLADRLLGTRPRMKVIFVSGYTGDVVVHHGIVDPGVVLVEKPFTAASLLAQIGEVLGPAKLA